MNMRVYRQDAGSYHQVSLEIGKDELKKQSEQARRLGNDGYKNHAQAGSVKSAVQSLQPEQLLAVLKDTQQALGAMAARRPLTPRRCPCFSRLRAATQRPRPAVAASAPARLS